MKVKKIQPGMIFGNVKVLSTGQPDKHSDYLCHCECLVCGKTFDVMSIIIFNNQRRGNKSSCGCNISKAISESYTDERKTELKKWLAKANGLENGTSYRVLGQTEALPNNKLGVRNVFQVKGRYRVFIKCRDQKWSKSFSTLEEAIAWRDDIKERYIYPEIPNEWRTK